MVSHLLRRFFAARTHSRGERTPRRLPLHCAAYPHRRAPPLATSAMDAAPKPAPAPPAGPPELPASASVLFARMEREKIKAEHPDWNLGMVGRELSERWEALGDDAKRPFLVRAAADKERYDREKAAYDAANLPAPVVAEDVPVVAEDVPSTDEQFAKAVACAKKHNSFAVAVAMLGVKLEDVVRASMHAWIRDETDPNYDEQMDFKGKLSRAVIPLMGVKTAQQHKDEEAAARRAARALKPAANKKSPPPLREKSERIEKAEKVRAAAAEQAAKDEPPIEAKPAPKKRKVAKGGSRKKKPCEMPPDERAKYWKDKAEKKAKEDAAGADEFKAVVAEFEASSWVEEDNYVAIVDELKSWVARGGTAATAAGWIGRLMIATKQAPKGKGGEGYTPHTVRKRYKAIWPGAAS